MPRGVFRDLANQKFGLWTALYRIPGRRGGKVMWVCICECRETGAVQSYNLTSGRSAACRSCGSRGMHQHPKESKGESNGSKAPEAER